MDKFDIFLFEQHYQNGECHLEMDGNSVNMFENEDCYMVQIEPPHPEMVCLLKTYYSDTLTLKTEGHYLKLSGTEIGVWKTYNQFGDLIEETDYEEGWKTSWDDLIPLLSAENIVIDHVVDISRYVDDFSSDKEDENEKTEGEETEEPTEPTDDHDENVEEEEQEEGEVVMAPDLDPFDFLKEYFGDSYIDPDTMDLPPVHYWVVTELMDDGSVLEHTFDSDLGKKVWEEQKFIHS